MANVHTSAAEDPTRTLARAETTKMLESSQTAPEERGQSKPYWLQDLHKPQEWPLNLRLDPRLPGEDLVPCLLCRPK